MTMPTPIIGLAKGSHAILHYPAASTKWTLPAGDTFLEAGTPSEQSATSTTANAEKFSRFSISALTTSIQAAASLKLATIFSGDVHANETAVFFDSTLTTDYYAEAVVNGVPLYAIRHGIGLRLALRASDLDATLSIDYASIAASVALKASEVSYQVVAIGMPLDVVSDLMGAIPLMDELSTTSYTALHDVLAVTLPKYIDEHQLTLAPAPFTVGPLSRLKSSAMDRAQVINFAMLYISKGYSLREAFQSAPSSYDRDLIAFVYSQIALLRDVASDAEPDRAAKGRANAWLRE